jgi:predicted RNA-binding protein YlxR (DUF448 family)
MMMTTDTKTARGKRAPATPVAKAQVRTCAGCGVKDSAPAFVRVVLDERAGDSAGIVVDVGRSSFGRGAHVHPRPDCLTKACKAGFSRAFKTRVTADVKEVARQLVDGCDRRMEGMLVAGRRAGHLAVGADAACEALAAGAHKVIVARDAGTVVGRNPIASAVAQGRAIAWGTKESLGRILGRDEVAVVAVLNLSLSSELAEVFMHGDACRFLSVESTSEAR